MTRAYVLGRWIVTVANQATGCPFVDGAGGRIVDPSNPRIDGRTWQGYAIVWPFGGRNRYGERHGRKALFVGRLSPRFSFEASSHGKATFRAEEARTSTASAADLQEHRSL